MIVLDTHVAIWYAAGMKMKPKALKAIDEEVGRNGIVLSAISAWEIGMLVSKGRLEIRELSSASYVNALFQRDGVNEQPVTATIAELAARLPGNFHGDPADRIIVATAVNCAATLATRDSQITAYAHDTAFVAVLDC